MDPTNHDDDVARFPIEQIRREQFEAYESVILSGQMPESAVPKFMEDNPAFAAW
ncbi:MULTISPECIES: hypothetical protein [unclassified Bradyrhizobium]|uniref:hypothetical protein n=1 Tax=unclassified Bradyrhizobium TaxID=2631580 RepID=UPI002479FBDF|nr:MULTISPECIES: hypothetical protein [unclassified Bradyrhizobium]WGS22854.1 hypothetical protein MTX22_15055 [Bradyrhizobium sp. ISRA463]WGS29848.1 hypothetical protein MTX19_12800 [Bradyrhizobium sp. ISRA464]